MEYTVSPIKHQPEGPEKPEPITHPWGKGMLAAATLVFGFVCFVDILYAAWLLGGGS